MYKSTFFRDKGIQYIGFTSRLLIERLKKKHVNGNTTVSDHIGSCSVCKNTQITDNDFKIVKECHTTLETFYQ